MIRTIRFSYPVFVKTIVPLFFFIVSVALAESRGAAGDFPLSSSGRFVVDAKGNRFKLKSVNWWGASDTTRVVRGLDQQHISVIIGLIREWGFNSVRLPFSNEMLHDRRPVAPDVISSNPELIGLTPIEVYDYTVKALTDAGIAVILNNHTTTAEWCCNYDFNGLWHHQSIYSRNYSQTSRMWEEDWAMLANRYKNNPSVVGADLRNEVRTARLADTYLPSFPNWGKGGDNDWHQAAQNAGNAIHKVNPNLLIIVEGINWTGIANFYGIVSECMMGGRPVLAPIRNLPIRLNQPNKVVYSAHQYHFTGPKNTGARQFSGSNPTYGDLDQSTLRSVIHDEWGYVLESGKDYTAPVWLSEFGISPWASPVEQGWFVRLVDYLIENDVDFAFWPLNGNDSWGLVSSDWSHILKDDWRYPHMRRLLDAPVRPLGTSVILQ